MKSRPSARLDFYFYHGTDSQHVKAGADVTAAYMLAYLSNLMGLDPNKKFALFAEGMAQIRSTEQMGPYAHKKIQVIEV